MPFGRRLKIWLVLENFLTISLVFTSRVVRERGHLKELRNAPQSVPGEACPPVGNSETLWRYSVVIPLTSSAKQRVCLGRSKLYSLVSAMKRWLMRSRKRTHLQSDEARSRTGEREANRGVNAKRSQFAATAIRHASALSAAGFDLVEVEPVRQTSLSSPGE